MWTSSGFLILKSKMAAYETVLLVVLTTDIAGVKSEWLCNNICCAGAFSLGSKKCEKLRPCSDTGQYIIRAGNETQDNKCWCDEGKGFSPIRPKLCWEKSEACGCLQCPEGSKPNVIDKNGQYVEHFDKDKHCKRMCEPTGNTYEGGIGIGIGIAIVIAVIIVVWFIPWIYYCRRYNKYTFPLKFMPIDCHKNALRDKDNALTAAQDSHENALRDKDNALTAAQGNARKDVISMGKFVLDNTLITKFEKDGLLSKEDTEQWIKDTFEKIRTNLGPDLPEANPPEEVLILRNLEACKGIDDPFPLGESLRCITKPTELNIIRCIAINVLKDILRSQSVMREPSTLLNCLVNSEYRNLASRLQDNDRGQPNAQEDPLEDIKWLAQSAFDWKLVTTFMENNFLTQEDIIIWLKGTYTEIFNATQRVTQVDGQEGVGPSRIPADDRGQILIDLTEIEKREAEKFPLVRHVPFRKKIRRTAIKALKKVIEEKEDHLTRQLFHTCLSQAGYQKLVDQLKVPSTTNPVGVSYSAGTQPVPSTTNPVGVSYSAGTQPDTPPDLPLGAVEDQSAPSINGASGSVITDTTDSEQGRSGQNNTTDSGQPASSTTGAPGPDAERGGDTGDDSNNGE